jgi:acetylornithine/N-succinyldiaminopimelate aminotransferase
VRITDVRGLGLLVGVELSVPVSSVISAATQRGLMLISAGENVLRLCPPLIIDEVQMKWALEKMEDAIRHAGEQFRKTAAATMVD